jgi:hypothetical protein
LPGPLTQSDKLVQPVQWTAVVCRTCRLLLGHRCAQERELGGREAGLHEALLVGEGEVDDVRSQRGQRRTLLAEQSGDRDAGLLLGDQPHGIQQFRGRAGPADGDDPVIRAEDRRHLAGDQDIGDAEHGALADLGIGEPDVVGRAATEHQDPLARAGHTGRGGPAEVDRGLPHPRLAGDLGERLRAGSAWGRGHLGFSSDWGTSAWWSGKLAAS